MPKKCILYFIRSINIIVTMEFIITKADYIILYFKILPIAVQFFFFVFFFIYGDNKHWPHFVFRKGRRWRRKKWITFLIDYEIIWGYFFIPIRMYQFTILITEIIYENVVTQFSCFLFPQFFLFLFFSLFFFLMI